MPSDRRLKYHHRSTREHGCTASTATVQFTESARDRDGSGSLQVFQDPATRDDDEPDDEFSTGTTLADFE